MRLQSSTPAAGAVLTAPPEELRLTFSQAVEARYTSVVLTGPSGARVPLGPLLLDGDSRGRSFIVAGPALPAAGEYRVEWRTAGADGHIITGTFVFTAEPDAVTVSAADTSAAPASQLDQPSAPSVAEGHLAHHATEPPSGVFASQSLLHIAVRALQFAALLALIGGFVLRRLLERASELAERRAVLRQRLHRYTVLVLSLFLLLLPLRLWLQSGALHGPTLAFDPRLIGSMLVEMGWGRAWLAQLVLGAVVALTFATPLRPLAMLATAALAFTPALLGHAAGIEQGRWLVVATHGLHVLAAGAWIGTLAALFLVGLPALRTHDAADAARADAAIGRFSPLALSAAALLVGAGVLMSWLHLGSPALLPATAYGRTLLVKLGLLAVVFGTGFANWRRTTRRAPGPLDLPALRRRIALELGAAAAVVIATAVLVAQPTP